LTKLLQEKLDYLVELKAWAKDVADAGEPLRYLEDAFYELSYYDRKAVLEAAPVAGVHTVAMLNDGRLNGQKKVRGCNIMNTEYDILVHRVGLHQSEEKLTDVQSFLESTFGVLYDTPVEDIHENLNLRFRQSPELRRYLTGDARMPVPEKPGRRTHW